MLWKWILFCGALSPVLTIIELSDVKELSYAVADKHLCQCIIVMFPSNSHFHPTLMDFGRRLAHGKKHKLQLTAYNFASIFESNLKTCYNPLYIVMENAMTRNDLEMLSKKYRFQNSIWLVVSDDKKSEDFFENITLTLGANLFSVNSRLNVLVIHEIFRIASGFPVRVNEIGLWDRENGLRINGDPTYKRHSDMEGFLWRVGTIEYWPVTSFVRGEAGWKVTLDGFFARVWLELETLLNFTSVYIASVDGTSGRQLSNGSWTGMCGMLSRGEIDIIIGDFSMSTDRQNIIESLLPLLHAKLNVFYRPEGVSWNWNAILRPFDRSIWMMILIWLVVSTVSLVLMSWVARKCGLIVEQNSFSGFFALQTLCLQGTPEVPKFWAGRILFVSCYLTAAVLFPCYSASLISSLSNRTPLKPFDSLGEMLQAKYPIIILDNMVEYEFFQHSKNPIMKQAFEELIYSVPLKGDEELEGLSYKTAYKEMCTKRVAFFAADTTIQWVLDGSGIKCYPVTFSQSIAGIHQAMALPKNSQYREVLNYNILRLQEFGIIHKLHSQYMTKTSRGPLGNHTHAVNFGDILEILIFLAVGIIISIVILLAEVVIHK